MEKLDSHANDDAWVDPAALSDLPTVPVSQQRLTTASKNLGPSDALSISPAFGSGRVLWVSLPDGRPQETLEQRTPARTAWELGILVHTARELDVPAICVILTWPSRGAATYVIGVHATGMDWFNAHAMDDFTCDTCGDPCDDADLQMVGPGIDARDQNCIRCNPCSLCTGCSVYIKHEKVCLMCSTDTECENFPKSKQKRRRLVEEIADAAWTATDRSGSS